MYIDWYFQVRLAISSESDSYFKSTDMIDDDFKSLEDALDSQSSSKIADINSSGLR